MLSSSESSSMEQAKKRQRNLNFSRKETEKLLSLIEAHINIIGNKKNDAVTWKNKEKAWKIIEEEFNRCSWGAFRDARQLKLKFEALKRDIRKKERNKAYTAKKELEDNQQQFNAEEKMKELMLLSDEIVECTDNTLDSDGDEQHMENIISVNPFPEAESDIVSMQRQMIGDELEEKKLKKELLKLEIQNKQELHELQKTEMLLKIEILKLELENKKKLL